ncbi:MAG: hypothetical protein Q7T20_03790 [Saprospiraceae bacterium]|nr:hypothetical protein [Saprospiraceae bacterium]
MGILKRRRGRDLRFTIYDLRFGTSNLDVVMLPCTIENIKLNMRLFPIFLLITFFACESPASPETRGDKLAKSLCGCTTQLLALNQRAESASDSLAFRNIATEFEKARACATKLGIKPADKISLELALKANCPALAEHSDFLSELLGQ